VKLGIIGSGNLGTAFAKVMSEKHKILLYDVDKSVVDEINLKHTNKKYLPNIKLNKNVSASTDISLMCSVDIIILAVPSRVLKEVCIALRPYYNSQIVISSTKGLSDTGQVMTDVVESVLRCKSSKVLALSGPCIASELAVGKPTMIMLGGKKVVVNEVRKILESKHFYIKTTTDKIGIQLLGFYKNIIALLVGICEGLELGHNFESSLMTRAYNEFFHLTARKHIKIHTFVSPAGLGDLYVTAMSPHSRNRTFGYLIGKGYHVNTAKKKIGQTVEGYENLLLLDKLPNKSFIDKDLVRILLAILHEKKNPEQIKKMLLKYLYNYRTKNMEELILPIQMP
jgi:glycerol-3-phosphate dehydrogenase (NAD(P)+)